MTKDTEEYQRKQVQRSMFRTIAQNLIQQLQQSGCSREELIGFANEILQSIIDQGFEGGPTGEAQAGKPDGTIHRIEDLPALSAKGSTPLAEGISISPICSDDLPALRQWLGDQAVAQSLAEYTLPDIIEARSDQHASEAQAVFVLHCDQDRKAIGLVGLIHVDDQAAQGELVKMIGDPTHRGKGLAKMATQMLVDFGFDTLKLNRIYLRTLGGNMKNIRLNESLGFRFEGVLRQTAFVGDKLSDVVVMGMVSADRQ